MGTRWAGVGLVVLLALGCRMVGEREWAGLLDADGDGSPLAEDCDPATPTTRPKAEDDAQDGVDQNCDGVDGTDADGDGFASEATGGEDCDDADGEVNPSIVENTLDSVDQNCDGVDTSDDSTCPVITTTPISVAQPLGEDLLIEAHVTDYESGVSTVHVWFRQETSMTWIDQELLSIDPFGNYEGEIPGEEVGSAGMYYYISALDGSENECYLPLEGPDDPYYFRVTAEFAVRVPLASARTEIQPWSHLQVRTRAWTSH